jgi:hypothetical protein
VAGCTRTPAVEETPVARFVVKPASGVLFGIRNGWAVVDVTDRDHEVNRYVDRADAEARAAELNAGPVDLDAQEAWQPEEEDDEPWGPDDRWHDADR